MNGRAIEILVVPYDVERGDTPMARGPRGLLEHGFPDRLREAGWEVQAVEIAAPSRLTEARDGRRDRRPDRPGGGAGRLARAPPAGPLRRLSGQPGGGGRPAAARARRRRALDRRPRRRQHAGDLAERLLGRHGAGGALRPQPAGDPRGGRPDSPRPRPRDPSRRAGPSIPWSPATSIASGSSASRRTGSPRRRPASGSGAVWRTVRSICTWTWTGSIRGTRRPWATPSRTARASRIFWAAAPRSLRPPRSPSPR